MYSSGCIAILYRFLVDSTALYPVSFAPLVKRLGKPTVRRLLLIAVEPLPLSFEVFATFEPEARIDFLSPDSCLARR